MRPFVVLDTHFNQVAQGMEFDDGIVTYRTAARLLPLSVLTMEHATANLQAEIAREVIVVRIPMGGRRGS